VLLECPADVTEVALPHRCPNAAEDAPIPYKVGQGGRVRLAEGETLPVTARCHRCGGRAFISLVDPAARERRLAEVRPDPTVLRAPSPNAERVRRFAGPPLAPANSPAVAPSHRSSPVVAGSRQAGRPTPLPVAAVKADPCPACGQVPDSFGHCRCSA
jgi:hypothetical protein